MGTTDGAPIGEGEERGNKSGVIHPPSEMAACDWSDLSLCLAVLSQSLDVVKSTATPWHE